MEDKMAAQCPICKQLFSVPARHFRSLMYTPQGLIDTPSSRAYLYHGCVSNGVKKHVPEADFGNIIAAHG